MKAHTANLMNAVVLILMSLWGFFAADKLSFTALIPTIFGIGLIACHPGVKAENKVIAHIAVVLTIVISIALFMPLRGAIGREDISALIRVGLMELTTVFALVVFVKSLIDARRHR